MRARQTMHENRSILHDLNSRQQRLLLQNWAWSLHRGFTIEQKCSTTVPIQFRECCGKKRLVIIKGFRM